MARRTAAPTVHARLGAWLLARGTTTWHAARHAAPIVHGHRLSVAVVLFVTGLDRWTGVALDGRVLSLALVVWLIVHCALVVQAAAFPLRLPSTARNHLAFRAPWRLPCLLGLALPGAAFTLLSLGIASTGWLGRAVTFGLLCWVGQITVDYATLAWADRQRGVRTGLARGVVVSALGAGVGVGVTVLLWRTVTAGLDGEARVLLSVGGGIAAAAAVAAVALRLWRRRAPRGDTPVGPPATARARQGRR